MTAPKAFATLCTAACLSALPLCAFAQTPPSPPWVQPELDRVSFNLSAEDWVETTTARVTVDVDAAMPGEDASRARADMQDAMATLARGATWKFVAFDHSQESGLDKWNAQLETRLKEGDLDGLQDRAKKASRPGLQLSLTKIEYTPTVAEVEATRAKLRARLYGQINDELKQLQAAEPDRKYRMGDVAFTAPGEGRVMRPMVHSLVRIASPQPSAPEEDSSSVPVEQKIRMEAQVELVAPAPKE